MSHTEGPWKISKNGLDLAVYADREAAFDLAVVMNGGNEAELQANASLIASAPDLLAACQAVLEFADNGSPVHPGSLVLDHVRDAVARATNPPESKCASLR